MRVGTGRLVRRSRGGVRRWLPGVVATAGLRCLFGQLGPWLRRTDSTGPGAGSSTTRPHHGLYTVFLNPISECHRRRHPLDRVGSFLAALVRVPGLHRTRPVVGAQPDGRAALGFLGVWAVGVLELWEEGLSTLALMGVAVIISLAIGIPLGIAAWRSDRFARVLRPTLRRHADHARVRLPHPVRAAVRHRQGAVGDLGVHLRRAARSCGSPRSACGTSHRRWWRPRRCSAPPTARRCGWCGCPRLARRSWPG